MIIKDKNNQLYSEFAGLIQINEVRDAFNILLGAAASIDKFESYPEQKGVISDFRFYTSDRKQPFAFIINNKSLLFYLRPPAIESKKYVFNELKDQFDEVKENPAGEWTIRIQNRDDAFNIITQILNKW